MNKNIVQLIDVFVAVKSKILACLVILLASLFVVTSAYSADHAQKVYFAGFALAGNAAESTAAFPITSKLLQEKSHADGMYLLEAELWKGIQRSAPSSIHLERGLASDSASADAIAMAFVLEWENVSTETVAGRTKLVADLHGQILIFDFQSMKAIGSYPVAYQLIDVLDNPPTEKDKEALVRGMYFGATGNSIFNQVAKRLPEVSAKPSTGNNIQIVSIDLEAKAMQTLKEMNVEPNVLISRTANTFGQRLFENARVSYIPYSKGTVIGSKMAARFANGDVYQLELPTPDYRIYLRVRGFKKAMLDSNDIQSAWGYASYMHLSIKSFDGGAVYIDGPFKFAVTKNVIKGTHDQDDWTAYQESLFALIDQTTKQMAKPDSDWLDEWASGDETLEQFERLSGILDRAR